MRKKQGKPVLVWLTEELHQKAINDSRDEFGYVNVSSHVRVLIKDFKK
ncbi:MAG: hypothetical protein ACI8Q1_003511 [Parvicella sp.]|jgi:hypothetical protein